MSIEGLLENISDHTFEINRKLETTNELLSEIKERSAKSIPNAKVLHDFRRSENALALLNSSLPSMPGITHVEFSVEQVKELIIVLTQEMERE